MIRAMVQALWRSFMRDRLAILLTFALPCVMFTVFALIFGGGSQQGTTSRLDLVIFDHDQSAASKKIVKSLSELPDVDAKVAVTESGSDSTGEDSPTSAETVPTKPDEISKSDNVVLLASKEPEQLRVQLAGLVRKGKADAVIIFPEGFQQSIAKFGQERVAAEVIYDPANPFAKQMLSGVLQASAFTSVPEVLIEQGFSQLEQFGGPLTVLQSTVIERLRNQIQNGGDIPSDSEQNESDSILSESQLSMTDGLIRVTTTSARDVGTPPSDQKSKKIGSMIPYYAAGISVMFLMFSMSGAASALLEHEENGTLERLLSGHMTPFLLLISHWLFYVLMGLAQISVMFLFASFAFGLDLWNSNTFPGAVTMSVFTAMASAGFVLMLATLCRTRKQLEGMSSIIILVMSAFGGSMVPRFIMPKFVSQASLLTFNGWALDGYLKVFWYNVPGESILLAILPEVSVLSLWTVVFLSIASVRTRRWAVT
ncbi:MAG: ABC transporter permease [Planctomyces sp.]|nr:ABC transporter permease [Planctomyces sp.]